MRILINLDNIVLGGVEGSEICFEARLRTDATKTSDEYCIDLKMILDVYGVKACDIEGSIIASVVPQVLNSMQTAVKKLTGKAALVVGPGLKTGLNILLENPGQTGADLVVADVAALREHKPPMIVIDMGTATTMTVIDTGNRFIGGAIIPGVAFDRHGARLGRGKGYYDRLLPQLSNAYRIGICFPFQMLEHLPSEPHDVLMNEIVS